MSRRWRSIGTIAPLYTAETEPRRREIPPLRETLSVFRRPRAAEDEVPRDLEADLAARDEMLREVGRLMVNLGPELTVAISNAEERRQDEGIPVLGDSRLLLRDLGPDRDRLYALATTTGRVAYYVTGTGGHGGVAAALPNGFDASFLAAEDWNAKKWILSFGLVGDGVAALEAEFDRGRTRAVLGSNGFYLELEGSALPSFIVRSADGAERRVGLWGGAPEGPI